MNQNYWKVKIFTWNTSGAIDESKDHASESPGDALNPHSGALRTSPGVSHDRQNGDVQEEEGGDELGDASAPEGPWLELPRLEERRRRRLGVVLGVGLRRSPDRLPLRELVRSHLHVLLFALHYWSSSLSLSLSRFFCFWVSVSLSIRCLCGDEEWSVVL